MVLAVFFSFFGELLEGVDVVEVHFVDVADGGVDVAGDGEVDHEEGAVFAGAPDGLDMRGVDDAAGGAGGGDDDVHFGEGLFPVVEFDGGTVEFFGEFFGAVEGAVRDDDGLSASGFEGLGGGAGHLPCPKDHDFGVVELAKDFLGEIDGDGADGGLAALDVGAVADAFADAEGLLEEFVEDAGGGAGLVGGLVGFFNLAKDFGFTEDHGVDAGDDTAEVAGGGGALVVVKVGVDVGGFCLLSEPVLEGGNGVAGGFWCGFCGVDDGVVFGAVTGGEDEVLGYGRAVEGVEGLVLLGKLALGHGEAFPDFNGGAFVVKSEAEEHL